MLLCKSWTNFLLVYLPWLTELWLYCFASQNLSLSQGFLYHVSSKNHSVPWVPSVELGFSGLSSGTTEIRNRILQHTWRLITVCIILISLGSSFHIGNPALKTSVCDSASWCWDLFQQTAAAWVAQGRGDIAAVDPHALDLRLFCPISGMGIAPQCLSLGNAEGLLFPSLQLAFYSQLCNLSLKQSRQHFPEPVK